MIDNSPKWNRRPWTVMITTEHGTFNVEFSAAFTFLLTIDWNNDGLYILLQEGAICVWHPNMTMDKHYVIADHVDDQKRRFRMWVTDAIYLRNCEKIAIASTSRDIRFYDVSSSQYFEEYHLFGEFLFDFSWQNFFSSFNCHSWACYNLRIFVLVISLINCSCNIQNLFMTCNGNLVKGN